ncbi:MAG: hypothetical protein J6V00_10090 [Bacteroidaceae bacterium]|nr:hypothetical protein [Bacteroidaceae bacterium]
MKLFKLFSLMAIAAIAVSCSNDDSSSLGQGNSVQAGFVLSLEDRLATRAISDASGVDQLVYAVYDADGNAVVKKQTVTGLKDVQSGHEVSLPLLYNKTYTAVFWAQNSACSAYTISDGMELTVDYSGNNNDETRDAFFATETFTVNSLNFKKEVVLKRPFAQVNVGSYLYEVDMADKLGFKVTQSAATIKDVPNVLDLKTGETSGSVDIEYASANLPTAGTNPQEYLMVDIDDDGTKDEFEYLSMSYILANERSTHEMSFVFNDEIGNEIVFDAGLSAVPVERNWRTNIVGQVLSNDPITPNSSFTIKIDPSYNDDINTNNGYLYIYDSNTTIEDKDFVFNNLDYSAEFGVKKNSDTKLTYKNVTFAGEIGYLSFGVYATGLPNNELENVTVDNLTINGKWAIKNNNRYIAIAAFLYGKNVLKNCTFKNVKIDGPKDSNGYYINQNGYVVNDYFDCAFVNLAESVIDGGEYGRIYNYEHAKTTITGDAHIAEIVTATFKEQGGYLKIEGGTVDKITVNPTFHGSYQPTIVIEAGATVKEIDFNGKTAAKVVNNSGKTIIYTNVAP